MARIASKLLDEQLSLARRILTPQLAPGHLLAKDIMRLAAVTLEIHQRLSSGTPFPSAWLSSPSPLSESVEAASTDS